MVVAAGIAYFGITSARDADARSEEIRRQQQEIMDEQQDLPEGFCETAKDAGLEPPQCE